MLKNNNNKRFLILLTILLVIMVVGMATYFVTTGQFPTTPGAWSTSQRATTVCADSGAVIKVNFTNTEPNDPKLSMKVVVVDDQTGKSVDLGAVDSGKTATGEIQTGQRNLNSGTVRFKLTWTDGHSGSDSRSATYSAVNCPQITPTSTPTPSITNTPTPTKVPTPSIDTNLRISNFDCTEVHIVSPAISSGFENSSAKCTIERPDASTVDVTVEWDKTASASTGHWRTKFNIYYTSNGNYVIKQCIFTNGLKVENLPFYASLKCGGSSPTPTPTICITPKAVTDLKISCPLCQ